MTDAYEIGLALAYPVGLDGGLETMIEGLAALDDAASWAVARVPGVEPVRPARAPVRVRPRAAVGTEPAVVGGLGEGGDGAAAVASEETMAGEVSFGTGGGRALVGAVDERHGVTGDAVSADVRRAVSGDVGAGAVDLGMVDQASLEVGEEPDGGWAPSGGGGGFGNAGLLAEMAEAGVAGVRAVVEGSFEAGPGWAGAVASGAGARRGGAAPGGPLVSRVALRSAGEGAWEAEGGDAPGEMRAVAGRAGRGGGGPGGAEAGRDRVPPGAGGGFAPGGLDRGGPGGAEGRGMWEGGMDGGSGDDGGGGRGFFSERSIAPQGEGGGGGGGSSARIELDGRLVGYMLSEQMARSAARPGAGPTFFDARQGPAWTPSGVT